MPLKALPETKKASTTNHFPELAGDLLDCTPSEPDLIVFSPPWMLGEQDGLLDQALFYEAGLFERFFDQAQRTFTQKVIVLVFSNVIRLVQLDIPHPIEAELERGHLRQFENAAEGQTHTRPRWTEKRTP